MAFLSGIFGSDRNRSIEQQNQVRAEVFGLQTQQANIENLGKLSGQAAGLASGQITFSNKNLQAALDARDFSTLAKLMAGDFPGSERGEQQINALLSGIKERISSIEKREVSPGVREQTLLSGRTNLLG